MIYRSEIDGMRALAVVPVILFHAGVSLFSGGFVGVDVFFVISGFLITTLLLEDLEKDQYSLLKFYERRARRLLPALIFVILCCVPLAMAILLPSDLIDFGQSVISTMTFSSNILFWLEVDYFETDAELKPLLHTWSLAVEEQYYLLFPPVLAALFFWHKRAILPGFGAAFLLSLIVAQVGATRSPDATFFLLPTRAFELLLGSIAAFVFSKDPSISAVDKRFHNPLSMMGLILVLGSIFTIDETVPFPSIYALYPTVGTVLILLFGQGGTFVSWLLSQRIFVAVGLISYSAYLWHQPLIAFYKLRFPATDFGTVVVGLSALPLAWLTWKCIETPFRAKRVISSQGRFLGSSLAAIATVGSLGGLLLLNDGWKSRFTEKEQATFAMFSEGPDYVPERFDALMGQPFPSVTDRRNVLIIGDSFGQDLVNALFEINLSDSLNVSTYHISATCGNLHIEDLTRYQKPEDVAGCGYNKGYGLPGLSDRMSSADEVWLASSWNERSLPLINESLKNILAMTDTPITVFGRKHFGKRSVSDYYENGIDGLLGNKAALDRFVAVQASMESQIPAGVRYIDVQYLLCGDYATCTNSDAEGRPLTFDGSHLTRFGASVLGQKLRPLLADPFIADG